MADHRKDHELVAGLLKKMVADSLRWNTEQALAQKKNLTIAFLNAHGINTALRNREFSEFLQQSDYLLRDGIGIKLATNMFGLPETENLNGSDLIPKIVDQVRELPIAIFGTSDAVLAICKSKLEEVGVRTIVSTEHGFHPHEHYLQACKTTKPAVLILCMGMPRQEVVAKYLREHGFEGVIVCGGGWADFFSETKARAPEWVRKASLEWLFRFSLEPRRLGKRYTVDVVSFFYSVARARVLSREN